LGGVPEHRPPTGREKLYLRRGWWIESRKGGVGVEWKGGALGGRRRDSSTYFLRKVPFTKERGQGRKIKEILA